MIKSIPAGHMSTRMTSTCTKNSNKRALYIYYN